MRVGYFKEIFKILRYSFQIGAELLRSVIGVCKMQIPFVTILGGSKESSSGLYYRQAYELSRKFVKNDVSVLTGGGNTGIMEAVSSGAVSVVIESGLHKRCVLGVTTLGLDQFFDSPYSYDVVLVNHFFVRKWLLSRYSVGFVFFPGGLGTIDELFDVLNLIKYYRIPEFPVILVGKDFWKPLNSMLIDSCLKRGLIDDRLTNLFIITDSVEDAFEIVYESCKLFKRS